MKTRNTRKPVFKAELPALTPAKTQVSSSGKPKLEAGGKAPKGLIESPEAPASKPVPSAVAVSGHKNEPHFAAFMRVENMTLEVDRQGELSKIQVPALCGKGHNCTMVIAVLLGEGGQPSLLIKGGNTRAAHTMRGRPYVSGGMIGGRWDVNIGADPAGIAKKVGIAEVAEEVGARVAKGGAFTLGDVLVPTMPSASTEADLPVGVIAKLDPGTSITGDYTGMELVGLMKQVVMPVDEALDASRKGEISEGGRFEAYARRFLDKLGYLPELGVYVHDLPKQLQSAFAQHGTLGLGEAVDPRKLKIEPGHENADDISHAPKVAPKAVAHAAEVNGVQFLETKSVPVPGLGVMYDASTDHAVMSGDGKATLVGKVHPNQILHMDHDLSKVAIYYRDPLRGPMVRMSDIERPVMAAKGTALADEIAYKNENYDLVRRDLMEIKVELPLSAELSPEQVQAKARDLDFGAIALSQTKQALAAEGFQAELQGLGSPVFASPGQCDLQLHFFAAKLETPPSDTGQFVPLSEALRLVRAEGQGDAGTEAALLRLAHALDWVPSLGMSVDRAAKIAGLDVVPAV